MRSEEMRSEDQATTSAARIGTDRVREGRVREGRVREGRVREDRDQHVRDGHVQNGPISADYDGIAYESDFDTALWGYDRRQVDRCIEELATQLEQAIGKLDSVETLQAQLCQAHLELDQLRHYVEQNPPWTEQLSSIMETAERLRRQAARDADQVRLGSSRPVLENASKTD